MFYNSKFRYKYNQGYLYFFVTFKSSSSKQDSWSIRLLLLCKKEPHPFYSKYSKNILSQVIVVENNSGVEEEASQVVWNETTNGGKMRISWKCNGANFRLFYADFSSCYVFIWCKQCDEANISAFSKASFCPGGSSRSGDQPPREANPLGGARAGVAVAKRGTVWKSPRKMKMSQIP